MIHMTSISVNTFVRNKGINYMDKTYKWDNTYRCLNKFSGIGPPGLPLRFGAHCIPVHRLMHLHLRKPRFPTGVPAAHLSPRKHTVSCGPRFREHCQAANLDFSSSFAPLTISYRLPHYGVRSERGNPHKIHIFRQRGHHTARSGSSKGHAALL